ncbi:unnamed protein product [Phaedon cochleariae]|uniref:TIR domain-containing protein n=1 Tax=Phaedon cochleariae TaxID=80249 RepID=A0A9N9SH69_PHACE|nr:unnamed protein product [Phaedon cochleariae]
MRHLAALLILFGNTPILGSSPTNQCKNNDLCGCINSPYEYEFQCPKSNFSVVIHTKPETFMRVECYPSDHFDLEIYPNYTAGNLEYLDMNNCPLPDEGFQPFIHKFGINKLNKFEIEDPLPDSLSEVAITKDFFRDMSSLQYLGIINLRNTTFDEDFLQYLPNLTTLDLNGSNLKEIGYIFKHTPQLLELYLPRISIKEIPDELFKNLTQLQRLHLWQNQLTVLTNDSFIGLKNLRSLELSSNKIASIEPYAFSKLPMLINISLRRNNLGHVSSDLFRNNSHLKKIHINNNSNLTLADKCFANLKDLTELYMGHSKLHIIPENIFDGTTNIAILDLQNNLLEELPVGIFKESKKLKKLNLSSNRISSLPEGIFSSTDLLEELNLEDNLLSTINENTLNAKNLKKLVLNNNRLSTVTYSAFDNVNRLISLDLSNNTIELNTNYNPFSHCTYLEELNLSGNQITTFPYDVLNMVHLESLNLSKNRIQDIKVLHLMALSRLNIDLTYNIISYIDFDGISFLYPENRSLIVVDLEHNVLTCDCLNFGLIQYLDGAFPITSSYLTMKLGDSHCAEPQSFQHIRITDLKPRHISCPYLPKGCPEDCECFRRPFDETVVVECAGRNLKEWPVIGFEADRIELNLINNMLDHSPNVSAQYNNITNLFLSNNRLEEMEWVSPKIQVLKLDGNSLTHIKSSVLKQLSNSSTLRNITLTNNPWDCGCIAFDLQNFIRANSHKVNGWTNVLCKEDNKPLMDKKVLCTPSVLILQITLPIVLFILFIVALTAIYAFFKQEIKIWMYANNLCLWFVTEEELDKDKEYDIFICYSHKDEDFVMQNLLPVLEDGPNPFKVCIHVRDFLPGEFILTSVNNSVLNSKRTLVVLSNNFLESSWGKLEFRTAHTQTIEEGRTRLVVIKYGNLNEEKLDDDLKMYLKTNTYVEWGKPWFWNKLRYALPHTRAKETQKLDQKHANMMLKIDDKFVLALPPLTQPESTPPVMVVDPPIKNHQLSFRKAGVETPPAEAPTIIV